MTQKQNDTLQSLGALSVKDIHGEIEMIASTYGEECDKLLLYMRQLQAGKLELEGIAATIDGSLRENARVRGEKTTEKTIAHAIEAAPTWRVAKERLNEIEFHVERQKLALKTLDKKERAIELTARFLIKELGINAATQT